MWWYISLRLVRGEWCGKGGLGRAGRRAGIGVGVLYDRRKLKRVCLRVFVGVCVCVVRVSQGQSERMGGRWGKR